MSQDYFCLICDDLFEAIKPEEEKNFSSLFITEDEAEKTTRKLNLKNKVREVCHT